RAYTRWMRNFGLDEQRIVIGGVAPAVVKGIEKCDVQFFPEGGELVEGVRSRVAVKAVGANGLGKDIKGTIEDNAGNVVADFSSQHLGMGVFALLPEPGKTYRARVNAAGETAFTVDLPKPQASGYTLSVNYNARDSIGIKIATNEKTLAADKDKTFYIIAQSNGKIYYTTQGKLEGTAYTASIAKSRFPEGISQFTLFSQSGEPQAERIAFIDNKADELNINLNTTNQTYQTRDKVILNIIAQDSINKPATGSFSVSVINESKVSPDENEEGTILNNLLLTSELKGYIEQPNYYFINENDKTKADLDLLLLTQGYRRYEWKPILTTTTSTTNPTKYPPEPTQELSGTITTPGGKVLPNSKITLAATKQNIFRDTTADGNGRFTFNNLAITDTATLVIKARKANNGNNVKIVPTQPDYPKIAPPEYPAELIITDTSKARQQFANYQQEQKDYKFKSGRLLKTVTIKGNVHPPQPKLQFSSNLNGPGHANQIIMWNELSDGCINLSDCLTGRLTGVYFSPPMGIQHKRIPYLQRAQGRMSGLPGMTVIIDGMVMDGSHLDDVSPTEIYSIEILRSGGYLAIYGSNASAGAIVITTKRGGEGTGYFSSQLPNGITTCRYTGFYKAKAFYTPKFTAPKKDTEAADLRSTIYWNPNILTDKDGKASFEYYNADTKGTYRVVVEGIDDEGKIGRQVFRYEVK
ncbi:MAG: carboxypeptidase regulatory-like domain-containing protein, partial [Mucilaginibacter sp.]